MTTSCLNSTTFAVCANPNQYVFWDQLHPTTTVDTAIAESAYAVLSVPEPSDGLGILALGALGAVAVYKHKQKKKASPGTTVVDRMGE